MLFLCDLLVVGVPRSSSRSSPALRGPICPPTTFHTVSKFTRFATFQQIWNFEKRNELINFSLELLRIYFFRFFLYIFSSSGKCIACAVIPVGNRKRVCKIIKQKPRLEINREFESEKKSAKLKIGKR